MDAQREAIADVERLLQRPDDLKRLPAVLQSYTAKLHASKSHLTSAVAAQVDATRAVLEVMGDSQESLGVIRDCYAVIDTLCLECASLIENQDKIQVLSAVHFNLGKTLQDVENIVALPNEARVAEEKLQDDFQLAQAYEMLSILEGTSHMAQQVMHTGSALKGEDTHNLEYYFDKVNETMVVFEERLWSILRHFVVLGRDNPALLVNAVRIVELQEMVDSKLEATTNRIVQPKRYKRRCEQQIAMCIQDLFAPLLQACSHLAVAGENTDRLTNKILEDAHDFKIQLADIFDYVTPCFPARYNIFRFICKQYHENMAHMLDCIGASADTLANGDILKVMGWAAEYQDTLRDLDVDDEGLRFPAAADRGCALLVRKYAQRMHAMLASWVANIVEADLRGEPRRSESGLLWTPGAVDFFRIINEQMQVVGQASPGALLLKCGQACADVMREFQAAQRSKIAGGLPEPALCAYINNNLRCYDEALEFAEHLEASLDPAFRGELDLAAHNDGFLGVAQAATAQLVEAIFADPALLALFQQLHASQEWVDGRTTASIVATLQDYLADYGAATHGLAFRRLAEQCLERTAAHYTAALLTNIKAVTEDGLRHMQADIDGLGAAFGETLPADKVKKGLQALEDLKEIAASDNVDTFVISYNSLLQAMPDIYPLLIERLIVARPDLLKADVREVMEQFKDVYLERRNATGKAAATVPRVKNLGLLKDKEGVYQHILAAALSRAQGTA